jgi:hypothetical protein
MLFLVPCLKELNEAQQQWLKMEMLDIMISAKKKKKKM